MIVLLPRIIAALLLFIAVADHPYSYYQILRWVVCGVSAYSAFGAYQEKKKVWAWIFGIITILFNPIAPIHFQRETWAILDVVTGCVMAISLWLFRPQSTLVR